MIPIGDDFYHKPVWRKARKLALQRDHYLCQMCLRKTPPVITPATEVHHKKTVKDHPELALVLSNLESLCWHCHEETKVKGKKPLPPSGVRVIKA